MQKVDRPGKGKVAAGFGDRLSVAAAAKKAQLEKFKANKVDVNDPAFLEQQAARQAAAAAREERQAQRKAEKEAAKEQVIAERKAAQKAAEDKLVADRLAAETAEADAEEAKIALAAQQKAARDARYAARKARK